MADPIVNKVIGSPFNPEDWNNITSDSENSIISSGQTPSNADLFQISKAMANYAAVSTFYTDSGVADAYVLTPIGAFKSPNTYIDGMEIRFRAGNNGTGGAATVNVNALGVKSLKEADGTTNPTISTTEDSVFRYDGAVFRKINTVDQATESTAGIAEIATATDAKAFTDDARIITPLKLSNAIGQIAIFGEERSSGSGGGTFTSGAWQTRVINTTNVNNISGASLVSDQIILPAGTYISSGYAEGHDVNQHQTRVQNITAGTTLILGLTSNVTASSDQGTGSIFQGVFTLAVSSVIEVQHRCFTTQATNGFGDAAGWGTEKYSSIMLQKIA